VGRTGTQTNLTSTTGHVILHPNTTVHGGIEIRHKTDTWTPNLPYDSFLELRFIFFPLGQLDWTTTKLK
ncbi:hypothetical protein BgiBS90_032919, partial [Biomphalaria glabrata]